MKRVYQGSVVNKDSEYYLEKIQSKLEVRRSDASGILCLMQKRRNIEMKPFDVVFDEVIKELL